jgi:NAD(P)-dependent dehydrogenase (short-subunit alcohol dehydrogenase family)
VVDVTSDESITSAFSTASSKFDRLDVLVNNAGADFTVAITTGRMSVREGWQAAWDVNVVGTHILTTAFIPLLLKSQTPRLLFITSGLSSLEEIITGKGTAGMFGPPQAGWPKTGPEKPLSYRASKTGMNMMVADWARVLHHDGVKVFNISPGYLATGLGDHREHGEVFDKKGALDPAVGGGFVAEVVAGKRDNAEGVWPIRVLRRDMIQPY